MLATATKSPVKQATWLDRMQELTPDIPEPPTLLSRDEFIARLRAFGTEVDVNDLRFWEYQGILPRAVKRWHAGANRVFYPPWMLAIVVLLREVQALGVPLREIGPHVVEWMPDAIRRAHTADRLRQRDPEGIGLDDDPGWLVSAAMEVLWALADTELADQGRRYRRLSGLPITHVEVSFVDADGNRHGTHWAEVGNASASSNESD